MVEAESEETRKGLEGDEVTPASAVLREVRATSMQKDDDGNEVESPASSDSATASN